MGLLGPNTTVSQGTCVYLFLIVTIIILRDWTIQTKALWTHTTNSHLQWFSVWGNTALHGRKEFKKGKVLCGATMTKDRQWRPVFGRTRDAKPPITHWPVLHSNRTASLQCRECPQRKKWTYPQTIWTRFTRMRLILVNLGLIRYSKA